MSENKWGDETFENSEGLFRPRADEDTESSEETASEVEPEARSATPADIATDGESKEEPSEASEADRPATASRSAESRSGTERGNAKDEEKLFKAPADRHEGTKTVSSRTARSESGAHGQEISPGASEPSDEVSKPEQQQRTTAGPSRDRFKVGLVGGKYVGKSYLFQSLIYRCINPDKAGALTPFLAGGKPQLFSATEPGAPMHREQPGEIVDNYKCWRRLDQTQSTNQRYYRLQLRLGTSLGRKRQSMDFEFFDGSGEQFFELGYESFPEIWRTAFGEAEVMIFCLPLWTVFPGDSLTDEDETERQTVRKGFGKVVRNYEDMRKEENSEDRPVQTVLALTMADDPRVDLEVLQRRWIDPFIRDVERYSKRVRKERHVMTYLENARRVSDFLAEKFDDYIDPVWGGIPAMLDFGAGRPWLVPVSAIDGESLNRYDTDSTEVSRRHVPTPIHVELPLLLALAHRHNVFL